MSSRIRQKIIHNRMNILIVFFSFYKTGVYIYMLHPLFFRRTENCYKLQLSSRCSWKQMLRKTRKKIYRSESAAF